MKQVMTKRLYSPQDIENYKYWESNIKECNQLRQIFPTQILVHKNGRQESEMEANCPECGGLMKVKFGDFSKALDEKMVLCKGGTPEEGHGWWASVVNLVLN